MADDTTDTTTPLPPTAQPDGDSLAAAVFHLTRLLSRRERRGARGGFAVHRGRGRLLAILALRDQMTQKELAYLLGVRSQTLGEQLAQLERDGLVRRTADETDRRTWQVALTDAGREAAARATESGGEDPFAVLSADERTTLAELLEKVAADLRTDDDRRPPRPEAPEGWGLPGLGPRRGRGRRGPDGPDGWADAPARGRGRRGPDGLARGADAPARGQGRRGPGWAW